MKRKLSLLLCAGALILPGCGAKREPAAAAQSVPAVEERVAKFGPPAESDLAFHFVDDGVGELLREKLTPAGPDSQPIPFVSAPKPWQGARLADRSSGRDLPLSLAGGEQPHVFALEKPNRRFRRVLDAPPLATAEPILPMRIELPTAPLASDVGPDPSRPPAIELTPAATASVTTAPDPTPALLSQTIMRRVEVTRTEPAPAITITISEPGPPRLLTVALPEADAPSSSGYRPAVSLPVK